MPTTLKKNSLCPFLSRVAASVATAKGREESILRSRGNRARATGRGKGKSTPNAISHAVEAILSSEPDFPGNLLRESSPRDTCAHGDLLP